MGGQLRGAGHSAAGEREAGSREGHKGRVDGARRSCTARPQVFGKALMEEKGLGSEPTGCRDPAVHSFPVPQGRALEYLGFQTQCVWHPGVCPVIRFLSFDLQHRQLLTGCAFCSCPPLGTCINSIPSLGHCLEDVAVKLQAEEHTQHEARLRDYSKTPSRTGGLCGKRPIPPCHGATGTRPQRPQQRDLHPSDQL